MPVCPECGASYKKGVKVCHDCGRSLVSDERYKIIEADREKLRKTKWVVVAESPQVEEVVVLRARLMQAGIDVVSSPEIGHAEMLPAAPIAGPYELMVPADQENRAKQELENFILEGNLEGKENPGEED